MVAADKRTRLVTKPVTLRASASGEDLEVKQLNGRDHLVVPMVILVEGVLFSSNADHPALALAEEFGIFPQGWDGRPVVFNHPKRNEEPVSANAPDMWESQVIGQLFGSAVRKKKKLHTYAWIDMEKAPGAVIEGFQNGDSFEVSTGLYALEEQASGVYDGEKYSAIWRNIVPDHLAILSQGSIGACSIDDGCGAPRNNTRKGQEMPAEQPKRPAISRGTAPKQPATNNCMCKLQDNLKKDPKFMGKLLGNFASALRVNELSDVDVVAALEAGLDTLYSSQYAYMFVVAVYSDTFVWAYLDPDTYMFELCQSSYSVTEGGPVSISSDMIEVRPETQYVPLVVEGDPSVTANAQPTPKGPAMSQEQPKQPEAQAAATAAALAPAPVVNKAKNLDELLALAEGPVADQVKSLIKANDDRRTALIASLTGKVGLEPDELRALPMASLEKMAKKFEQTPASPAAPVQPADFSGAAVQPVASAAAAEKEPAYTPPTKLWGAPAATQH